MDISQDNSTSAADAQSERQQWYDRHAPFPSDTFLGRAAGGITAGASISARSWPLEGGHPGAPAPAAPRPPPAPAADPRPELADAAEWQSVVVRLATLALAQPGTPVQDAWRPRSSGHADRAQGGARARG